MRLSKRQGIEAGRQRSSKKWASLLLCCALGAATINLLSHYGHHSLFPSISGCITTLAGSSSGTSSNARLWKDAGPDRTARYWLKEFRGTLATMQSVFWNDTSWPTTIQWIGAFMDTLIAASDRSLLDALNCSGNVSDSDTTTLRASEIKRYFHEIEAYYGDEDVIQIFDAAYDDAQWVVLEWLEAIKFIDQYGDYAQSSLGQADVARFAHRAHIFYNIVQDQFDTSLCGGGINWNPALATYKNAITNELFLASSIAMYLFYPGDSLSDPYPSPAYANATNTTLPDLPALAAHHPLLLQNAIEEYQWFKTHNFTNAQGLIVDGFHITDNQTTCDERNEMVYTYNQGVLLSGLRGLWDSTGEKSYLDDGHAFISTTINATGWNDRSSPAAHQWAGLGRNGIMEDYCDAPANCSQDNQIFKGIYFHHLGLFCGPLPTSTPLVAGLTKLATAELEASHSNKCASYLPWIEHNAHAALATRNDSGISGGWWGASYVNKTQEAWPTWAPPKPSGSIDLWNEPWVLRQPPWKCQGRHECSESGRGGGGMDSNGKRMASLFAHRRMARRDVNDQGLGRTVETQASGLGVVKAASDFASRDGRHLEASP
ncbi:hypothetical protein LTR29_011988 [Friedmanniomyces endolithicus]|nr:hypothetical protein LTS02_011760 [Friedmanniomyces endolithicus]KAK0867953.1 hypothetical protein LTR87_014391 [Friedmanniomyces endolithicus]KAK0936421.1 hypothetical protein LTR29_011988 [Friedmanniomyces endolithicus]